MEQIYIHGLGQSASSWDGVLAELPGPAERRCLQLADLLQGGEARYDRLYRAVAEACDSRAGTLCLCGLSLGGVLGLHYAIEHPQKVRALALIATPYKMPGRLLRLQNMLFRLTPAAMWKQTGFGKAEVMRLCETMAELDLSAPAAGLACRTLVVCGEKDRANKKSAVALAGLLPRAELCVIRGAGHEVNLEAPQELAKALRAFFGE